MSQPINHLYEFGRFRLDAAERLLLRHGEAVQLTPKAFDLLLVLVQNHGHLLEKDELLKRVWPDSFVEEANLSYNVSLIRKALGEGENGQRYIETVPKRGYRFVAGVREMGGDPAEITEAAARHAEGEARQEPVTSQAKRRRKGALLAPAVLAIAIGGIAFGLYKFTTQSPSKSSGPEPPGQRIVPFTSFPGNETQPAFSPDGNQIAFVWDGEQGNNQDIYVKLVDAGGPLPLTTDPAPDSNPVWSPDGRHVAFIREGESGGVYLIPALGGTERRLTSVVPVSLPFQFPPGNRLSWSPDGKFIAVAHKNSTEEPFSLFALAVETGERRRLTSPPAGYVGDQRAAFSPDGKLLAFIRNSGVYDTDLYVAPIAGGEPRRLTFVQTPIFGLAWTADGREIVFSSIGPLSFPGNWSLWKVPAAGGTLERIEAVGRGVINPAISRQGNRLAFAQARFDYNIWRLPLRQPTAEKAAPVRLISSTYSDDNPQYAPDGKRIVFGSDRSGGSHIWLCDSDGANPTQLTNLAHTDTGTPRWSPDGRQLAFDSLAGGNRDLYLVSADGGQPRRLTKESSEDVCPSWSRDGRWIYFGSNRSGSLQIWKLPTAGGQAVQVTRQGGFEGFESPDGRFFYYAKGRGIPGIWRIPVEGGAETPVLDHHQAGLWRSWAVVEQGIYFATAEKPTRPLIEFFSFATGKVTQITALEKPISRSFWGLAISPDGQWLLFTQMDQQSSDIMLMENFR